MRTGRFLVVAALAGSLLPGAAQAQFFGPYYGYGRPFWRPFYRSYYRPFYRSYYRPYYRPYYAYGWPYERPFWRPPVVYAVPPPAYDLPPAEAAYGVAYPPPAARARSARRVIHRAAVHTVAPASPVTSPAVIAPNPAPPAPSHDVYPPERPGD